MSNRLFLAICMLIICFGCDKQDKEKTYTTSATIYLINETSAIVKSDDILGYVIQPGETLIRTENLTSEYSEKPNIEDYNPFATNSGSRIFIYGDNFGDDNGGSENLEIDNVDGYTIRQIEVPLMVKKNGIVGGIK